VPAFIDKALRMGEGRILRQLARIADQVNSIEDEFHQLSDADLRAMTSEFRQRLADGESLDDLLPVRQPGGRSASARSTCRSWAAPPCTWATSPR